VRSADAFVRVALECGPGQGCWVIPPRLDLSPPSRPMPRAKTQRRRGRRSSSRRAIGKKSGWLAPWRQGSLHRLQLQRSLCPAPSSAAVAHFLRAAWSPKKEEAPADRDNKRFQTHYPPLGRLKEGVRVDVGGVVEGWESSTCLFCQEVDRLGRGTTPSTSRPLPRRWRRDMHGLPLLVIFAVWGLCLCVCAVEKGLGKQEASRMDWRA